MEVVASLSQGRTAAAQCGLFTYKSVPVIFEPPCTTASQRSIDISLTYVPCVFTLQSRSEVKCLFYNQSYLFDYTKAIVTLCATDSFTML